ncbi:glycoside hydrolase family 25 protein [Loktanella sp. M215]|uniref:glycoside hydrolase family 25 protein n=1 Tax=Loktanella sp. M215 TaxID=2675431 RepID=UPI001F3105A5|nr:glycoside hydrolase family 25 protein [Loktanella sp. M215]MCF7698071.1 glycoside hydrolase [Loktanella sp. M215]
MRSFTTLMLCAVLLAGCGGRTAQVSRAAPVSYPSFADVKPHDNVGRQPSFYPIHGVDVSRYQGNVDWRAARASGISFAYIKATEGGDLADPMFHTYRTGAAAAGVRQGAYHFYYFCRSAREQAEWFIRNVPRDPSALPPVLDLEWNHQSRSCTRRPSGAEVRAEATLFLDMLERHYGKRPLVYTTPDFYHQTGLGQLPRTQFWLRSVAAHPSERYPGEGWSFWQYTGTGVVPGFARPVDINAFAGSPSQWAKWIE